MRNRWYRYFWTELGNRIAGSSSGIPDFLPEEMQTVLLGELPEPGEGILMLCSRLAAARARHIYGYTWTVLREYGFSRPLRLEPWNGISLLVPFYRNQVGVLPESFSERVPDEKRAMSLVARCAAAGKSGCELWVVLANWNDEILNVLINGGVHACSLDNLEALCKNEFRWS